MCKEYVKVNVEEVMKEFENNYEEEDIVEIEEEP